MRVLFIKVILSRSLMMYGVRSDRSGHDSSESASDGEIEPVPVTENSVREDPDLMLVPTIINKVVLPKLTDTLCTGAGAAGGAHMSRAASALSAALPRAAAGADDLRRRALRRLAQLAALALQRLDADNPMH
ncbi:hypothetical protein HF086_008271, partial [Spodoptera exigua]